MNACSRFGALVAAIALAFLAVAQAGCIEISTASDPKDEDHEDPSGTLLYENARGGIDLYQLNGEEVTTIFSGRFPGRFPDGTFVALDTSSQYVHAVSPGGAMRSVLFDGGDELTVFEPKVSHDGRHVAFTHLAPRARRFSVVVVARDGEQVVEIPDAASPDWSRDGRLVFAASWRYPHDPSAVTETQGVDGLFVLNNEMTGVTRLPVEITQPMHPSVSPNGQQVAFVRAGHIWTADIDGTDLRQITTGSKRETYPSWSPDGTHLALISSGEFESGSYSAVALVPSAPPTPRELSNSAAVWPRADGHRLQGVSWVTWR